MHMYIVHMKSIINAFETMHKWGSTKQTHVIAALEQLQAPINNGVGCDKRQSKWYFKPIRLCVNFLVFK